MLTRYTIRRVPVPDLAPPVGGIRQSTQHRTNHPLRPTKDMVEAYLASPGEAAWRRFRAAYLALLKERFDGDREPFDKLAALASENDVYLGCSCPTTRNPRPQHCHTYPALQFMNKRYLSLTVVFPE